MAQLGVRPASALTAGQAHPAMPSRAAAQFRRVLQGAMRAVLRAVDEAPFDLAWPPSPRVLPSRAAWRAAWTEDDDRRR